MKYAANYSASIKLDLFDEIIIEYDGQEGALRRMLEDHREQKIILSVNDPAKFFRNNEATIVNSCYVDYGNLIVRFYPHHHFTEIGADIMECIKEKLIAPYFFGLYVSSFDELQYMFTLGVSEVYLVEDICFDLLRANGLCKQHEVSIRAFPNIAQASVKSTPALKKFFIRPEDVEIYSEVIDTLEFYAEDPARQDILYKIYSRGKWFGDLEPLILDLHLSIDSHLIDADFGRLRRSCARRCMRGDSCRACDDIKLIHDKKKETSFYDFN